jgi:hypothetical protein
MLEKLKVGDFVFHQIDDNIYRYGTVVENGINYNYVKVCWITTNTWPVSTKDFYEDEVREMLLIKLESPQDIDRLPL